MKHSSVKLQNSIFFRHIVLTLLLVGFFSPAANAFPENPIRLTIMHTNDFHSHLTGLGPDLMFTAKTGDGDPVLGHAARLMTVIRSIKAHRMRNQQATLLVDAGDSMFGTLFHMLGPSPDSSWTPEYRFFHEAGYDAIGLGNHDFDADEKGLATSLRKARNAGYNVPLVAGNLSLIPGKQSPLQSFIHSGGQNAEKTGIQDYRIKLLPGGADQPPVKIGILGLVGPDAAQLCATNRDNLEFVGYVDSKSKADPKAFHRLAQERVNELRQEIGCSLVVVLLHGGSPEDEELAKKVAGIDIIISGHTHAAYIKRVGSTIIAQAGHGGANLGVLDLELSGNGVRLLNEKNPRVAINDTIPAEPDVLAWLTQASTEVNRLIEQSGFTVDKQVCNITRNRPKALFPDNKAQVYTASRILSAVNRRLDKPVDIFLATNGLVRSEYRMANGKPTPYAFSDIFKFSSLGFAADGSPGAPVVIYSLSRTEVKILFEILHWLSEKSPVYGPVVSDNVSYKINPKGIPLASKISDLRLNGKSLLHWPKRIRIASNQYFALNLFKIRNFTKGILRITPRDDEGKALTTFPDSGLPREHILLAHELLRLSNDETTDPSILP